MGTARRVWLPIQVARLLTVGRLYAMTAARRGGEGAGNGTVPLPSDAGQNLILAVSLKLGREKRPSFEMPLVILHHA